MSQNKKEKDRESAYKEKLLRLIQEIQSEETLKRLYGLAKRLHLKEQG